MVEYGNSTASNSQPVLHDSIFQFGSAFLMPSASICVKFTAYIEHLLYPDTLFLSNGIPSDNLFNSNKKIKSK